MSSEDNIVAAKLEALRRIAPVSYEDYLKYRYPQLPESASYADVVAYLQKLQREQDVEYGRYLGKSELGLSHDEQGNPIIGLPGGIIITDPSGLVHYGLPEDALRGSQVLEAASRGGQARRGQRKGPTDQKLSEDVAALHNRRPALSWSEVCRIVAQNHGVTGRTVARRASAADWRK